MFWSKRVEKLKEKDYIEYINNYEKIPLSYRFYSDISMLFLVNIIFMLSLGFNIHVLEKSVDPELYISFVNIWRLLLQVQIGLIALDIILRTYTFIKYIVNTNRFLKRCNV